MSLSTLTSLLKTGLCAALAVVDVLAAKVGGKVISILKEHFTFTAYEIAETYQESYGYALAAISAGLAAPDQKLAFLQKLTHSKITREFSEQLDQHYLQPFAQQRGIDNQALPALRKRLLDKIKKLAKQPAIFQAEPVPFTESELAASINHTGTLAITELVLEHLQHQPHDFFEKLGFSLEDEEELVAFLRYGELLGNAVLFFFRERLRKDERAEKTLAALQREGLWADVRDIKAAQDTLSTQLQQLETQKQAVISNAPEQTQQLQDLQLKPADVFRAPLITDDFVPEMVVIPAGQFRMGDIQGTGDHREKPVHEVSVKSFAMGRYPLTVAEFRQFVYATGYQTEAETGGGSYVWKGNDWQQVKDANWRNPSFPQKAPQKDEQPVVCISWNDTMAYIDWLTKQTGQKYCLPSEAQWEYAARAGTDTDYWWGKKFARSRVNCRGSGRPSQWSGKQTAPVGSFKPNPFGLYDTAGNVWEWCADRWWHDNYKGAPTDGSVWEGDGSLFVLRGGSWNSGARQVRSAYRSRHPRTYGAGNCGARLAKIL